MLMKIRIEVEVPPGCTIHDSVKEAIELAASNNCIVSFQFNSASVSVTGRSIQSDIEQKYFNDLDTPN